MNSAISELRELYRGGRLMPFIGAGVSSSFQWTHDGNQVSGPSWTEFADKAAHELGFVDAHMLRVRGTDLQILEYYHEIKGSLQDLVNWLMRQMNPSDADLQKSPIHGALYGLTQCRTIYTTNYDDFLERSLRLFGREVHAISDEMSVIGFRGGAADSTQVVKFHGDWSHPASMVITEEHYERRLRLEDPLDTRLQSDLLGRVVLFIGYSFRDPNVAYLFRLFQSRALDLQRTPHGRRAYIVIDDPSKFEIELFKRRNIEVIPVSRKDRAVSISELLNSISDDQ